MTRRSALLIGSLPFEDEERCMRQALDSLGPALFSLPDGEIGEKTPAFPRGDRIAWVMFAVETLTRDTERWRVVKEAVRGADGQPAGYDAVQKLKPLRPPAEIGEQTRFGYDTWFRRSYPVFRRLRDSYRLPGLKFQLGVPTGFAMGFAFSSKIDWLRYTGAFNTVIAREVNAALREAGEELLVQLEVPPELYAAYLLPSPLSNLAVLPIRDLLRKIDPGARIGIHFCFGDFHNLALVHPKTLRRMTALSNRLTASWPARHKLEYVHYPLAEGAAPPPMDRSFYEPLRYLRLPAGTRFVAGFIHEKRSLAENLEILRIIEELRGGPVDVASSCGLGRRTPQQAGQLLELTAQLCQDGSRLPSRERSASPPR